MKRRIRLGIFMLTCLYISESFALTIPGKEEKNTTDLASGTVGTRTKREVWTRDRRGSNNRDSKPVGPDDNPKNQNRDGKYPGGVLVGGEDQRQILREFSAYLDQAAAKELNNLSYKEKSSTARKAVPGGRKAVPGRNRDFTNVFIKDSKPATEFMIGVLTAKPKKGQPLTFVTTSGTVYDRRKTSVHAKSQLDRAHLIPLEWKGKGVTFVKGQVSNQPIFNVFTRKNDPAGGACTKDCAAQKLFHALGEYVKKNPEFTIEKPSDISMTELWYRKPGSLGEIRKYDQNQAVNSCDECVGTLPRFTTIDKRGR